MSYAIAIRSGVSRVLWLAAIFGALAGAFEGTTGLNLATSAPQQAAAAAMGCIWAIAPYVFARAFDELTRPS